MRSLAPRVVNRNLVLELFDDQLIEARRPLNARAQIGLFYGIASGATLDIPDPYYGTNGDFERVYRMILAASTGLSKAF